MHFKLTSNQRVIVSRTVREANSHSGEASEGILMLNVTSRQTDGRTDEEAKV